MKKLKLALGSLLVTTSIGHSAIILDLSTAGILGDIGPTGNPTGLTTLTTTFFADAAFTTLTTTPGGPISFDLTISLPGAGFFTQSGTGIGTASGAGGNNNNVLLPLDVALSNISTGGLFSTINFTEASFTGVFGTDSLSANEINIDVSLGTGVVTGDFADTGTLNLNVLNDEVGTSRITTITLDAVAVPEPSAFALLSLTGLFALRRKR